MPTRLEIQIIIFVTLGLSFGQVNDIHAQTLVPGIHGISIVNGIKFTWVIITSDREISVNLRTESLPTPALLITATALTKFNQTNTISTIGGSQVLNANWTSPITITIPIPGQESIYNSNLVTVVVSPYTGPPITIQPTTQTTQPPVTESQSGGCDKSYPDMCIAPPPPMLSCDQIPQKNFKVLPPDPHGFDKDKDGIGCETA